MISSTASVPTGTYYLLLTYVGYEVIQGRYSFADIRIRLHYCNRFDENAVKIDPIRSVYVYVTYSYIRAIVFPEKNIPFNEIFYTFIGAGLLELLWRKKKQIIGNTEHGRISSTTNSTYLRPTTSRPLILDDLCPANIIQHYH